MPDTPRATVLGTVTVAGPEDTDRGWSRVRDLAQAGGLSPLSAARLALAATGLEPHRRAPAIIQLTRIAHRDGARVQAVVRGGSDDGPLPSELVDVSSRRTSPDGTPEQVLSIVADGDGEAHRPAWSALADAAAHASGTRQLLAVALVAASRTNPHPGTVDRETTELRSELEETNLGLLALHDELSRRHDELEETRAAAVQANHTMAAFLANMSHEIRSPINAVVGFTSLLLETDQTVEQLEYAHAVRTAGRHLLGVIDDILDLSRVESGLLILEDITFDLYACVEDAIGIVTLQAAAKDLPVAALFAPDAPTSVRGDPLRLGQILVNLLSNAVKFTTFGQVTVEVTHHPVTATLQRLIFRVIDTGEGIPAETLGRLFIPFTQADTSTARSHGGTGLGLSISRQLAERMDGAITVDSAVGQGSTFTCTIKSAVIPAAATPGDAGLLAGVHVLVLHRSPLVTEVIHRHLRSWGAQVATATALDQALRPAEREASISVALIDADELDGFLRRQEELIGDPRRRPPIVIINALAHHRTGSAGAGVSAPIRRGQLRDAILGAIGETTGGPTPPMAGPVSQRDQRGVPAPPPAVPAAPGPVRRVLYVDDDPMMVELVRRILGRDPTVRLDTASDAGAALSLAAEQQPDIVLLDLNLGDVGGDALLERLRANPATDRIPVVIVSGDAATATIERLTRLGAADYLVKPFQPARLREVVSGIAVRSPRAEHPARG